MNLILAYSGRDFALSILILLSIHSRGVGAVSLRAGTTGTSGTTHHDGNSELASVCRQPLTPADLRQVTNWSSDRRTEDWWWVLVFGISWCACALYIYSCGCALVPRCRWTEPILWKLQLLCPGILWLLQNDRWWSGFVLIRVGIQGWQIWSCQALFRVPLSRGCAHSHGSPPCVAVSLGRVMSWLSSFFALLLPTLWRIMLKIKVKRRNKPLPVFHPVPGFSF